MSSSRQLIEKVNGAKGNARVRRLQRMYVRALAKADAADKDRKEEIIICNGRIKAMQIQVDNARRDARREFDGKYDAGLAEALARGLLKEYGPEVKRLHEQMFDSARRNRIGGGNPISVEERDLGNHYFPQPGSPTYYRGSINLEYTIQYYSPAIPMLRDKFDDY